MKKNKILVMMMVSFILLMSGCQKSDNSNESNIKNEKMESEAERTEEESSNPVLNDVYQIAVNGVLMEIPKNFEVSIDDETGNIYINDEDYNYELVLVVRDGSYEESLADKESLMDNAKQQDVTIVKSITECQINDKSYAYFTFEYNDKSSTNTVAYTGATLDKRIGMNFIINSDMTEEEVLKELDIFLHNIQSTDLEDSVQQDIEDADNVPDGQLVETTQLEIGNTKIETGVADGYYLVDSFGTDISSSQTFESENQTITVNTQLFAEGYYENPEDYISEQISGIDTGDSSYSDVEISDIETVNINGNEVLYANISYVYESEETFHKIYAVSVLENQSVYLLEAYTLYDEPLTIDTIKDFMEITIK